MVSCFKQPYLVNPSTAMNHGTQKLSDTAMGVLPNSFTMFKMTMSKLLQLSS